MREVFGWGIGELVSELETTDTAVRSIECSANCMNKEITTPGIVTNTINRCFCRYTVIIYVNMGIVVGRCGRARALTSQHARPRPAAAALC